MTTTIWFILGIGVAILVGGGLRWRARRARRRPQDPQNIYPLW